jgi:hypothetical protein
MGICPDYETYNLKEMTKTMDNSIIYDIEEMQPGNRLCDVYGFDYGPDAFQYDNEEIQIVCEEMNVVIAPIHKV